MRIPMVALSGLSSRGLQASQYVGTATRARELEDLKPIALSVAQNSLMDDLLLPRVEAAAAAAARRVHYASSWLGDPEAREAVARVYNRHILSETSLEAERVAVVASATSAIDALLYSVLERGDVVLTPAPYYGSYRRDVEARAECVLRPVPSTDGAPTLDALEEAYAAHKPRALLLASPHNPCGTLLGRGALAELVDWSRRRGVHLIVDEALSCFGGAFASALDVAGPGDAHVHVVYSASKDLALAGYRVGALVTSPEVLRAVTALGTFCSAGTPEAERNQPVDAASMPAQAIVAELLADDAWLADTWIPALRGRLGASWRLCRAALEAHGLPLWNGVEPESGHFCLLDLRSRVADPAALAPALESAGVLLTPGPLMGAPDGVFRLCHAAAPAATVRAAVGRIAEVVDRG